MTFSVRCIFRTSILMALLAGTALPVSAALIYEWVSTSGSSATGTIELNEGIVVGDLFGIRIDVAAFDFNVNGTNYGMGQFGSGSSTWEAGSLRLCSPNCIDHGTQKRKTPKAAFEIVYFTPKRTEITPGVYDDFWSLNTLDGSILTFIGNGDWVSVTTVPAPGALILFLSGIGVLGAFKRRFNKARN